MQHTSERERARIAGLLARRERQGLSWSELAASSGLSLNQLFYWRRQFAGERPSPRSQGSSQRANRASFVPVEVTPSAPASAAMVEITTPTGFQLRVAPDIAGDDLRRIVEALTPAC